MGQVLDAITTILHRWDGPLSEEAEAAAMLDIAWELKNLYWPATLLERVAHGPWSRSLLVTCQITEAIRGTFFLMPIDALQERDGSYPWWVFLFVPQKHLGAFEKPIRERLLAQRGVLLNAGFCPEDIELPVKNGVAAQQVMLAGWSPSCCDAAVLRLEAGLLSNDLMAAISAERLEAGEAMQQGALWTPTPRKALPERAEVVDLATVAAMDAYSAAPLEAFQHDGFLLDAPPASSSPGRSGGGGTRLTLPSRALQLPLSPAPTPASGVLMPAAAAASGVDARTSLQQARDAALTSVALLRHRLQELCASVDTSGVHDEESAEVLAERIAEAHDAGRAQPTPNAQLGLEGETLAATLAEITLLIRRELPDAQARAETWVAAVQHVCGAVYGHEWPLVASGEVRCTQCFQPKPKPNPRSGSGLLVSSVSSASASAASEENEAHG